MSLEKRQQIKAKKPTFTRQNIALKKRLEVKWRKPKGLQSKMRLQKKGRKASPSPGWGSPVAVRGLDRKGRKVSVVSTKKDIDALEKGVCAVIASTVGMKKRVDLIAHAQSKSVEVVNVDAEKFTKKVSEQMDARKAKRKSRTPKAVEKKEEKKKDAKDTDDKKAAEPKDAEEKKKEEKQEKDKVLTKKA